MPPDDPPDRTLTDTRPLTPRAASPEPDDQHDTLHPANPDRYEFIKEFARGGVGVITEARDRHLGHRPVAIKQLIDHLQELESRFRREVNLTARLQHPGIVPLYDAGKWPSGEPFYSMKLVEGRSLDAVLKERATLEERLLLLPNLIAVAEAIAYAHEHQIIHRDLKPSNVLVGAFGETVVIDWGLAKDMGTAEPAAASPASSPAEADATAAGAVVGTAAYMPPEQARGEEVDARADVYALGGMLYQLLAGRRPYARGSSGDVLKKVIEGPPPPVESDVRGAPDELVAIVSKAMARDRSDRYPSAKELVAELLRFQNGQRVAAYRYSALELAGRWIRRHRAVVQAAGLLLLGAVVATALSLRRIVAERDAARASNAVAQARSHELILTQARNAMDLDPTAAVAWLKQFPPEARNWADARDIASTAEGNGVARHVWRGPAEQNFVTFSRDGKRVISGVSWAVQIGEVDSGKTSLLPAGVDVAHIVCLDDGSMVFGDLGGKILVVDRSGHVVKELIGHTDLARQVTLSPDRKQLASGSADKTVRLWDLASGRSRVVATYGHTADRVGFSPDGRYLASSSQGDALVRVVDLRTGQARAFPGGWDYGFTADSRRVLVTTPLALESFDLQTNDPPRTIAKGRFHRVVVSPDGERVAAVDENQHVLTWGLRSPSFDGFKPFGDVRTIAFSPDSSLVAIGQADHLVTLWSPTAGSALRLRGHGGTIESIAFSPDGKWLASAADDASVRLWALRSTDTAVLGSDNVVWSGIDVSPDGKLLALGRRDGVVDLWDAHTYKNLAKVATGGAEIHAAAFSPDGRTLAASSTDVYLIDVESGALRTLKGHTTTTVCLRFDRAGKRLLSASDDDHAWLWEVASGTGRLLPASGSMANCPALSADGSLVAVGLQDGSVRLLTVDGGAPPRTIALGTRGAADHIELSPDGKSLAAGGHDGTVQVVDVGSGEHRVVAHHAAPVLAIRFLPDSLTVASLGADRSLRYSDRLGKVGEAFDRRGVSVPIGGFSPDGRTAIALSGSTIWLWDRATEVWRVKTGRGAANQQFAFDRTGQTVLVSNLTQFPTLWRPPSPTIPRAPAAALQWIARKTSAEIRDDVPLTAAAAPR